MTCSQKKHVEKPLLGNNQRETKGQQLNGQNQFSTFHMSSHFSQKFSHFPEFFRTSRPGLSPKFLEGGLPLVDVFWHRTRVAPDVRGTWKERTPIYPMRLAKISSLEAL